MKALSKIFSTALAVPILLGGAIVMAAPAQAVTCAPGYVPVTFNHVQVCSPTGTGGVVGGGTGSIGNGASTVPGKAPGVVAGNGGWHPMPPAPPAKKPAVPAKKVTPPVKAKPPVHKVVAKKPIVKKPVAKVASKKVVTIKK